MLAGEAVVRQRVHQREDLLLLLRHGLQKNSSPRNNTPHYPKTTNIPYGTIVVIVRGLRGVILAGII